MDNQEEIMICEVCRQDLPDDDVYIHRGTAMCEDCYMKALNPVITCDPFAVRSAIGLRGSLGVKREEGLTPLQKGIYAFIKNKGKVTGPDVRVKFNITEQDLNRIIATLRHCELVKGRKEGDTVYLVTF